MHQYRYVVSSINRKRPTVCGGESGREFCTDFFDMLDQSQAASIHGRILAKDNGNIALEGRHVEGKGSDFAFVDR